MWVEVGYGLEPYITDGFAGETSRQVMTPFFRQGDYGGGLEAGVARFIGRIAEARKVEITGAPAPSAPRHAPSLPPNAVFILLFLLVFVGVRWLSSMSGLGRRRGGWGRRSGWSGWNSGVGRSAAAASVAASAGSAAAVVVGSGALAAAAAVAAAAVLRGEVDDAD